jgi:phosphoglycerol transferase MdoB-like AlkP superfamily enzyme
MTLSNHEPFDVPGRPRFDPVDEGNRFRNSAAYTDECLGRYFSEVRKHDWFHNTLFVIVADHGHILPKKKNDVFPDSRKIPLVFYGDVILPEYKGLMVSHLGNQHDLPKTVASLLGWSESDDFRWSRNLLDSASPKFAYYQIEHVLGWVTQKEWYAYSYNLDAVIAGSGGPGSAPGKHQFTNGQAYIQSLYEEYRKY